MITLGLTCGVPRRHIYGVHTGVYSVGCVGDHRSELGPLLMWFYAMYTSQPTGIAHILELILSRILRINGISTQYG